MTPLFSTGIAFVHNIGFGSERGRQANHEKDTVNLTYTKWFAPAYPYMMGVVGGDIEGTFGGIVLSRTVDAAGVVHLKARYDIFAEDPSESFSAIVEGTSVNGTAVLTGIVTSGWLAGEQVLVNFTTVSSCALHPTGTCFQGTINVSGDSGDATS